MSGRIAAATVLAVVVVVSATIFGIGFAPEAHREEAAGEHAEVVEGGDQAEAEEEGESSHAEEEEIGGATAGAIASSILISLAGVALVPLVLVRARGRPSRVALAEEPRPERARAIVAAATVVALLSIGAAVIHFAVIAQHFQEWWLTGMFFLSIALFQVVWGLLVLIQPSALVYVAGAIVNALIVVTWIVSRTSGVPVGPEAGEAEAVTFPDALATAFEVVLVIVLVAFLLKRPARGPARLTMRAVEGWGSAAAVASLTALALVILA